KGWLDRRVDLHFSLDTLGRSSAVLDAEFQRPAPFGLHGPPFQRRGRFPIIARLASFEAHGCWQRVLICARRHERPAGAEDTCDEEAGFSRVLVLCWRPEHNAPSCSASHRLALAVKGARLIAESYRAGRSSPRSPRSGSYLRLARQEA